MPELEEIQTEQKEGLLESHFTYVTDNNNASLEHVTIPSLETPVINEVSEPKVKESQVIDDQKEKKEKVLVGGLTFADEKSADQVANESKIEEANAKENNAPTEHSIADTKAEVLEEKVDKSEINISQDQSIEARSDLQVLKSSKDVIHDEVDTTTLKKAEVVKEDLDQTPDKDKEIPVQAEQTPNPSLISEASFQNESQKTSLEAIGTKDEKSEDKVVFEANDNNLTIPTINVIEPDTDTSSKTEIVGVAVGNEDHSQADFSTITNTDEVSKPAEISKNAENEPLNTVDQYLSNTNTDTNTNNLNLVGSAADVPEITVCNDTTDVPSTPVSVVEQQLDVHPPSEVSIKDHEIGKTEAEVDKPSVETPPLAKEDATKSEVEVTTHEMPKADPVIQESKDIPTSYDEISKEEIVKQEVDVDERLLRY